MSETFGGEKKPVWRFGGTPVYEAAYVYTVTLWTVCFLFPAQEEDISSLPEVDQNTVQNGLRSRKNKK